jgi:hypothetical protein
MMPNAITHLFKEAHDAAPPLEGKPSNNDLLAIQETLLLLLMVIPYNQLNGVHSLTVILTNAVNYKANHGVKFVCLSPSLRQDNSEDTTTVIRVHAEAAHKSQLDNYTSYKAAD